ncbi:MAG: DNA-directed RNA polymerase subunit L [Candidatus Nanohaloarchaea archaeon]|jgi:DNA-directed RNA polymerase subunit L
MDITTVEKDDRLIIDMDRNHTVANLVRKALWQNGSEAGYDKGHPLGDESNLVVVSDTPEDDLNQAVETAKDWVDELQSQI